MFVLFIVLAPDLLSLFYSPTSEGWTFVDRMRSNPFGGGGNVSNQETVQTERNDNVETVSLFIRLDQFCIVAYLVFSFLL